jgi:O-antigen/teichoic acid export membrane protein
LERNLLASWAGLSALGLFTHSLAYQSMLAEMVKAVSRAVWPRTLAEARDTQSQFADTRSIWAGIYIGMTGVGIGAALLGKPFVAFLTHDQFTAAYVLLPFWVVAMIVQNMGRPQLGILLSGSGGRSYSQVSLIGNLGWLVALLVLLPYVGLVAAVLAITCQFAVMRVGIWLLARRVRRTSGPDRVALTGASGILLVFGAVEFLQPSLTARFVWCAVLLVALAAVCRRPLLDTAAHFRSRRPSPA